MLHFLRAALIFVRHQPWVNATPWDVEDAKTLATFLNTRTGARLKATLANLVLRQQAASLSQTKGLEFEAGFCNGQKSIVATIEGMADEKSLSADGEIEDTDHLTN